MQNSKILRYIFIVKSLAKHIWTVELRFVEIIFEPAWLDTNRSQLATDW